MENTHVRQFFVSYSHLDDRLVQPVLEILRATGAKVFRDKEGIAPGKKWRAVLQEALQVAETIVLFWSINYANSQEVKAEYEQAVALGKDIIPVLFDNTPLHTMLSEYQFIDFRLIVSRWSIAGPFTDAIQELADKILSQLSERDIGI